MTAAKVPNDTIQFGGLAHENVINISDDSEADAIVSAIFVGAGGARFAD